jgi:hypothetical protein
MSCHAARLTNPRKRRIGYVPIIILPTRLALMPNNTMLNTMTLLASLTPEFRFPGCMHLSRVTVFIDAPAEIGDAIVCGFCS